MAVIATNLTNGSGGGTSATTASISPAANSLIILTVENEKGSTPNPVTPTVTGAGMTWTQIATYNPFADHRLTIFRALSASPGSGTLTISCGSESETGIFWSIDQFKNVITTGTNGSGAIVQSGQTSSQVTDTSLSITLSALQNPVNLGYGALFGSLGGVTPGSGFSSLSTANIFTEYAVNKNIVNFTYSSTGNPKIMFALEIAALPPSGFFQFL